MTSLAATLGMTLGLLIVGFVALAYALVVFDVAYDRWRRWRHGR